MHLTKIDLSHKQLQTHRIFDSYLLHQRVWSLFPGRSGQPRDFLVRFDENQTGLCLLVLSENQPSRPDWCPRQSYQSKKIADSFLGNESYRFSLLANPTKKVSSNASGKLTKNGRRVALTSREDLLQWLDRKAMFGGFKVESSTLQAIPRPARYFNKKGARGTHAAIEFRGVLEVTDKLKFATTFREGIGPAKAFGFGMLCLSPTD